MRFTSVGLVALTIVAVIAACGGDDSPAETRPNVDGGADAKAALCVSGKPAVDYPPGPYEIALTSTVPDLSFDGPDGPVRMRDYFEPCTERSRLLVVRTSAAWCGTCGWHAEHTRRMVGDAKFEGRLVLLDLLVADEDNMPATLPALERWRKRIDAPGKIALDPKYVFAPALLSKGSLPEYVLVDTRTMTIQGASDNPDPTNLENKILVDLADLDKRPRPELRSSPRQDELFTEDQWDLVKGMRLASSTPPADPTNEFGDNPAAAALGKTLFSDKLLSPSGTVSCSTCHDPALELTDGVAQSTGVAKVNRNSPAIALAAHARWQFWDGRADTLWMQALGPFEDAKEFGSSRLFVAKQIQQRYSAEYAAVFGAKYPLPDLSVFPPSGKPGDAAYDALSAADKDAVTRIYVNVGKAIAAFERSLRVKPNALDRYAAGDLSALTKPQKEALQGFFKVGCAQCHWGPRLTDDAFHAIRFPTGRQDGAPDRGRIDVLAGLAQAEFVATSKWSDAPQAAKLLTLPAEPSMLGAFKTPTLRGLPKSGPYGHGGTVATLLDVAKQYGERGVKPEDTRAVGETEVWLPQFDANVQAQLPALLEVLAGTPEP